MATKELTQNVEVDGVWYGPGYPQNEVTSEIAERITNPAAYGEDVPDPLGDPEAGGYTIDDAPTPPEPEATKLIGVDKDAPAESTAAPAEPPPEPESTAPEPVATPLIGESDDAPAAKTSAPPQPDESADQAPAEPAKKSSTARSKG